MNSFDKEKSEKRKEVKRERKWKGSEKQGSEKMGIEKKKEVKRKGDWKGSEKEKGIYHIMLVKGYIHKKMFEVLCVKKEKRQPHKFLFSERGCKLSSK